MDTNLPNERHKTSQRTGCARRWKLSSPTDPPDQWCFTLGETRALLAETLRMRNFPNSTSLVARSQAHWLDRSLDHWSAPPLAVRRNNMLELVADSSSAGSLHLSTPNKAVTVEKLHAGSHHHLPHHSKFAKSENNVAPFMIKIISPF